MITKKLFLSQLGAAKSGLRKTFYSSQSKEIRWLTRKDPFSLGRLSARSSRRDVPVDLAGILELRISDAGRKSSEPTRLKPARTSEQVQTKHGAR